MLFSKVEYLTIFSAIIYGIVAAEFFYGWGSLFKRDYKNVSIFYLGWSVLEFAFLIDVWWGSWIRTSKLSGAIGYYMLALTTPVLFYLIAVLTFPGKDSPHKFDVHAYFVERFPKFMFLFFLTLMSALFNSWVFHDYVFLKGETIIILIASFFTMGGFFWPNYSRAVALLIAAWILLLGHAVFLNPEFPENLNTQFSHREYLTIFVAIIYGYVATTFFEGWGSLIRNSKLSEIHWYHLIWTIFAFLLLVDMWWSSWQKIELLTENIGYFVSSLVSPLIFYFLGITLFMKVKEINKPVGVHFKLSSPLIFRLFALILLVNIFSSVLFVEHALFDSKNSFRLIGIIFALIAAYKKSWRIQTAVLVIAWILYFGHIVFDEVIK
ncbi:MAG: hypothetical protein OEX02_07520 [Cyclobacteriaceae bacterium]|nr:hypothetical protein [Cyclobacteriaceae bacterium]